MPVMLELWAEVQQAGFYCRRDIKDSNVAVKYKNLNSYGFELIGP